MTLELSTNGVTYENGARLDGAPAVLISATGVTFINLSNSLVSSNMSGQPAIRLTQGGNTIVNWVDAAIVSFAGDQVAISGSNGSDTLDNAGLIAGQVFLAGGNDTYIRRATASEGPHIIDLGEGDDTAQLFYSVAEPLGNYAAPSISGAGGFDTLEMSGPVWGFDASQVTAFERLVLRDGGNVTQNISNLTGVSQIALVGTDFINLIDSHIPGAVVQLNGGLLSLQTGSTVGSVVGGASSEGLWLNGNGGVSGSIDLGGGDDELRLQFTADGTPAVAHPATGGDGTDILLLEAHGSGQSAQFDLANITGFEVLATYWFSGTQDAITVTGATGFTFIIGDGAGASLTINNSNLPQAHSFSFGRSILTVGAGTTIGDYGVYVLPSLPPRDLVALAADSAANPLENRTIINNGSILGEVNLGTGNDLYDGRNGSLGGIVRAFAGDDVLIGGSGAEQFDGGHGMDTITGGLGNDSLDGGSSVDTAVVLGNRSAYTVTQTSTGNFTVVGPDGTDTLVNIEYLQFSDQTLRLLPGTGTTVDFNASPASYMGSIRDFGGNDLGGAGGWSHIGTADVDGDGDIDHILVNQTIGRFAEVATAPDGLVYFSDHSWAGETRVVGIYIDPLVQANPALSGGPFDSQARFQNDLLIGNINGVLGGGDYDHDGLQEVYFRLTDGTAYLHAYMHADGNIRYANYQNQQQVIDFLTTNGWAPSTYAGWFPAAAEALEFEFKDDGPVAASLAGAGQGEHFAFQAAVSLPKAYATFEETQPDQGMLDQFVFGGNGLARWQEEYQTISPLA